MADLATITIPVDSSAMVRAVKDAKNLERGIKMLVDAFDSGTIGSQQLSKGLLQLKRQYEGLFGTSKKATASVREHAKSLQESKAAALAATAAEERLALAKKKAETAYALGMQRAREEERALQELTLAKQSAAAREDMLRQKYDESYRAMAIYRTQIQELNEALSVGALTKDAYRGRVDQLNKSLSNGSILLNSYTAQASTGMNKFGVAAQQTGYQVSDFIVQVQGGTNPLVAFSQQATQLAGLLYLLPPALQASSISLLGFSVSLSAIFAGVTILIPLLSVLAMAFFKSGEEAKDTATLFGEAGQALSDLTEVSSNFERISADSFRVAKQEATAFLDVLRSIRSEKLNTALEEALSSTGIAKALQDLNQSVESIFSAEAMSGVGRSFAEIEESVYSTSKIFGLTATEAARLQSILSTIGGTTKEEIAASFFQAVERIKEANLLSEQTKTLIDQIATELGLVEEAYEEVDGKASSILSKLERMVGIDLSSSFRAAAGSVDMMNARLDSTLVKIGGILRAIGSIGFDTLAIQAETKALQAGASQAQARIEGQLARDRATLQQSGEVGFLAEAALRAKRKALEENAAAQEALTKEIDLRTESTKGGAAADKKAKEELTAAEKAAKEFADTLDGYVVGAIDGVANAWGDFVMRGFKDFKGFVKNILGSFTSMLSQMIALAARNKILIGLGFASAGTGGLGAVMGSGFTGTGGALAGLAGSGGIAGAAGGLWSGLSGVLSGGGIGSSFANLGGLLSGSVSGFGAIGAALPAFGLITLGISALIGKTKELDNGLKITVNNMDALVQTFQVIQKSRLFGLIKSTKTRVGEVGADVSDPIVKAVQDIQGQVLKAAGVFGIAESAFENFLYDFEVSLKGLTEEQKIQKVNEELAKMGDAFASLSGHFETMNELLAAANQRMELQNRLDALLGNNQAILIRQREAEIAATHELNRALLQSIYNLEDARAAVDSAMDSLQKSIQAEQNLIETSAQDSITSIQGSIESSIEAIKNSSESYILTLQNKMSGIVSGLESKLGSAKKALDSISEVYNSLSNTLERRLTQSLSEGQFSAQRRESLGFLSSISDISSVDPQALERSLSILSEPSENLFSTFVEYARDFQDTTSLISRLTLSAGKQLTADEKTVKLLEEQIDRTEREFEDLINRSKENSEKQIEAMRKNLDAQIASIRETSQNQIAALDKQYQVALDQYNAALCINTSVKSVGTAIADLSQAIQNLIKAQNDAKAATEMTQTDSTKNVSIAARDAVNQLYQSGGYSTADRAIYESWVKFAESYGVAETVKAWKAAGAKGDIPGFAEGGMHSGGLRIVGENGPELESTGPSRIYSNKQTSEMFRDPDLKDEIRSLRREVSRLRDENTELLVTNGKYIKRSYDIYRKWDIEGVPAERV